MPAVIPWTPAARLFGSRVCRFAAEQECAEMAAWQRSSKEEVAVPRHPAVAH